jgi:hypothetical protein
MILILAFLGCLNTKFLTFVAINNDIEIMPGLHGSIHRYVNGNAVGWVKLSKQETCIVSTATPTTWQPTLSECGSFSKNCYTEETIIGTCSFTGFSGHCKDNRTYLFGLGSCK